MEEGTFITQNEEVISPVGRNDTTLVGTDEADDSDLDDQLIKTDYKNTDDNESDNNSGRKEEISENEEEDDEEEAQRGENFASENRTPTDETPVETGDITDTKWEDMSIPSVGWYIPLLRTILRELSPSNVNPSYFSHSFKDAST